MVYTDPGFFLPAPRGCSWKAEEFAGVKARRRPFETSPFCRQLLDRISNLTYRLLTGKSAHEKIFAAPIWLYRSLAARRNTGFERPTFRRRITAYRLHFDRRRLRPVVADKRGRDTQEIQHRTRSHLHCRRSTFSPSS